MQKLQYRPASIGAGLSVVASVRSCCFLNPFFEVSGHVVFEPGSTGAQNFDQTLRGLPAVVDEENT